jgi:hypothetical protein
MSTQRHDRGLAEDPNGFIYGLNYFIKRLFRSPGNKAFRTGGERESKDFFSFFFSFFLGAGNLERGLEQEYQFN